MIYVWNIHAGIGDGTGQPWPGRGEYVGRGPRSPLGNPFVIGKDGSREEVIEKYRQWLWAIVKFARDAKGERPKDADCDEIWNRLMELKAKAERGDLHLLCYCKPLACHADVIKSCLEYLIIPNEKGPSYPLPLEER